MDIKFDSLSFLHFLWAIPALTAIYWYGFVCKRSALRRFAAVHLMPHLIPLVSTARQKVKAGLVLAAIMALILAVTGPRWGLHWEDVQTKGIDIMVVLDVSRSMLAEDVAPNRLERAKLYIEDLVRHVPGNRVGLVTFAGQAGIASPLTTNYGWLLMALDEVDIYSSTLGGSMLGDAIRLAGRSFLDRVKEHKVIVILSDGEDQESYPIEAARAVYEEQGIRVYTVGMGDTITGARIPIEKDGISIYLTYEDQEVWSKMNPQILQEVALEGGGAYVPAGTQDIDLGEIYDKYMASMGEREFESARVQRYDARYQWFAGVALLLLIIEVWMTDRKPPIAERVETRKAA